MLNPSFEPRCGTHTRKTFFVIEDFDAVSVFDRADSVVDVGNLIAQRSLWRRNIVDLKHAVATAITGGNPGNKESQQ